MGTKSQKPVSSPDHVACFLESYSEPVTKYLHPVISFCPQQVYDELHLPAVALDRAVFRCKADGEI